MVVREVEVMNRAGIHARPAALIVKVANQFTSNLYMEKDRMKINGKSIMESSRWARLQVQDTILTEGPDENDAADAIEHLFLNRFEE